LYRREFRSRTLQAMKELNAVLDSTNNDEDVRH